MVSGASESKRRIVCAPAQLLALVVALFALAVSDTSSSSARGLARNGLVAFERSSYSTRGRSCCTRLYTMHPDGSHVRHLALNGTSDVNPEYVRSTATEPVFYPSGRRIAFLGRFGIFSARPNGSDLRQILNAGVASRAGLH
jgi:hypothetical protein